MSTLTTPVRADHPTSPPARFAHIDALRAVAVMIVVFAHAGLEHVVPGGSGVTIFFTISGFIITWALLREHEETKGFAVGKFYARRAVKIMPPLALTIILPGLAYWLVHGLDGVALLSQLLFTYNWYPATGTWPDILPGSNVVWSLAIEEQFYIVFALVWLLVLRARRPLLWLGVVSVVIVVYSNLARLLFALHDVSSDRIYYGFDTRADGLAIGILAALLLHRWQRGTQAVTRLRALTTSSGAPGVALALYLTSLAIRDPFFRDTLRYAMQSIATSVAILYGFMGPLGGRDRLGRLSSLRPVVVIGQASYSIYLVHFVLFAAIGDRVDALPMGLRVLFLAAVGTGAGVLLWQLVERPLEALRKKLR